MKRYGNNGHEKEKEINMVSYHIFVGIFLGIVAIGITYAATSDMVDNFKPLYTSGQLSTYNDADSNYYYDLLTFVFGYFLIPSLITIAYWSFAVAQKPEVQQ